MDRIATGREAARRAFAALPDRFRALHDARYDCTTWDSWTDDRVRWVGCRTHHVEVQRSEKDAD